MKTVKEGGASLPEFGTLLAGLNTDEKKAQWLDYRAQSALPALRLLWPRPSEDRANNARTLVWAIGAGAVDTVEKDSSWLLERMKSRTNSATDELTMVCAGLEALYGDGLRNWALRASAPRPVYQPGFGSAVKRVRKAIPDASDKEIHSAAVESMEKARQRLVLAFGATIAARNMVQHGKAAPLALTSSGPFEHQWAMKGFGYLPRAPNLKLEAFSDLTKDKYFIDWAKSVHKALHQTGSQSTADEVLKEIDRIVRHAPSLTDALATARTALTMLLVDSTPTIGPELRHAIMRSLGWEDGLPWEDESP